MQNKDFQIPFLILVLNSILIGIQTKVNTFYSHYKTKTIHRNKINASRHECNKYLYKDEFNLII
jgi:hypothetical protein